MIQLKNISLSYGNRSIFDNLSWNINSQRKIGLFGPNGIGKTTLLNLIAGVIEPDSGSVSVAKNTVAGYLPQELITTDSNETVIDEVLSSFKDISALHIEMTGITHQLTKNKNHKAKNYKKLIDRLGVIEKELVARDYTSIEHKTQRILMHLGFDKEELYEPLVTFSGGWRMRVVLAKILLKNPNLLLLDEPTNHLDIESIDWLENYLKTFSGSIIIVSHDHYFLDRMVDTIAELDIGGITEHHGNYNYYLKQREARLVLQRAKYENQQKYLKQTKRFIERFRYKASKAKQVQSRIKMLEKLRIVNEPQKENPFINIRFPETRRSGKTVLELSNFSKKYTNIYGNTTEVFNNVGPLIIERGDKIALIGKNGAGKSTLTRILFGNEPFEGIIKQGYNVQTTLFDQFKADNLNQSNTIIEELQSHADGKSETQIRSLLGAFLFSGDDVFKPIGVLSGGEKSRVALAKTLLSPANFLILDEPTNHLDIQSRKILIEALKHYQGTFVIVSHDRYFLDNAANKVWYTSGRKIDVYPGTYSEYLESQQIKYHEHPVDIENNLEVRDTRTNINNFKQTTMLRQQKQAEALNRNQKYGELKRLGLENFNEWSSLTTNQLKNALKELEQKIECTEKEKSEIRDNLEDKNLYQNRDLYYKISKILSDIEDKLQILYEKWESISSLIQRHES